VRFTEQAKLRVQNFYTILLNDTSSKGFSFLLWLVLLQQYLYSGIQTTLEDSCHLLAYSHVELYFESCFIML